MCGIRAGGKPCANAAHCCSVWVSVSRGCCTGSRSHACSLASLLLVITRTRPHLANLLQAHILARDGGSAAPQPTLGVLPAASLSDLLEREDWAELGGQPTLEHAIQMLAESRLAEQVGGPPGVL